MDKIANTKREQKVFRSRIFIASVFMIAMALLIIYRLFNLQIINHAYYTEEALGNHLHILPIQPIRGNILDRNGKVLACLLYTSPSPRDRSLSRMPSSA